MTLAALDGGKRFLIHRVKVGWKDLGGVSFYAGILPDYRRCHCRGRFLRKSETGIHQHNNRNDAQVCPEFTENFSLQLHTVISFPTLRAVMTMKQVIDQWFERLELPWHRDSHKGVRMIILQLFKSVEVTIVPWLTVKSTRNKTGAKLISH